MRDMVKNRAYRVRDGSLKILISILVGNWRSVDEETSEINSYCEHQTNDQKDRIVIHSRFRKIANDINITKAIYHQQVRFRHKKSCEMYERNLNL